jgi:hypothetical protein
MANLRNAHLTFPEGWITNGFNVVAPCGCKAIVTGFTPSPLGVVSFADGRLELSAFQDCGQDGGQDGFTCVFQQRGRIHVSRDDIPTNKQVWEWIQSQRTVLTIQ